MHTNQGQEGGRTRVHNPEQQTRATDNGGGHRQQRQGRHDNEGNRGQQTAAVAPAAPAPAPAAGAAPAAAAGAVAPAAGGGLFNFSHLIFVIITSVHIYNK
jgi:hypothetical protein